MDRCTVYVVSWDVMTLVTCRNGTVTCNTAPMEMAIYKPNADMLLYSFGITGREYLIGFSGEIVFFVYESRENNIEGDFAL